LIVFDFPSSALTIVVLCILAFICRSRSEARRLKFHVWTNKVSGKNQEGRSEKEDCDVVRVLLLIAPPLFPFRQ
jgi:hypothetical protein